MCRRTYDPLNLSRDASPTTAHSGRARSGPLSQQRASSEDGREQVMLGIHATDGAKRPFSDPGRPPGAHRRPPSPRGGRTLPASTGCRTGCCWPRPVHRLCGRHRGCCRRRARVRGRCTRRGRVAVLNHQGAAIWTAYAASSLVSAVDVTFWPAWKSLAASRSLVSFWSRAIATIPPAESHCLRLRLSRTACAS